MLSVVLQALMSLMFLLRDIQNIKQSFSNKNIFSGNSWEV